MNVARIFCAALALCLASPASARSHHHWRAHHANWSKVHKSAERLMLRGRRYKPHHARRRPYSHPVRVGRSERSYAVGRPASCPPRNWCGCYLAHALGIVRRELWLAANWAHVGSPAGGPQVGVVVVWRHHVGRIEGRAPDGRWIVTSGNDGHRVRTRPRSLAGAIAFRRVS